MGDAYPDSLDCSRYDEGFYAFRWTSQAGLQKLAQFPGQFSASALASSANGTIIGGQVYVYPGRIGLLWNEHGQVFTASAVLASQAADLSRWKEILSVNGFSDNGLVFVGVGLNQNGIEEAFRAELDSTQIVGFSSITRSGDSLILSWPGALSALQPQFTTLLTGVPSLTRFPPLTRANGPSPSRSTQARLSFDCID